MSGFICRSCRQWQDQALTAPNPFDPEDTVTGCVHCKEIGHVLFACRECRSEATAGAPTKGGYRWLCSVHWDSEQCDGHGVGPVWPAPTALAEQVTP